MTQRLQEALAMLERMYAERPAQLRVRLRQTKELLNKLEERMAEAEVYFDDPDEHVPAADTKIATLKLPVFKGFI